jgi:hypothetical protein
MTNTHRFLLALFIILFAGVVFLLVNRAQAPTVEEESGLSTSYKDLIEVISFKATDRIESPLVVTGRARGPWYFEASFPVELVDVEGTVVASGIATAQGAWMTEEFVPFSTTLTFEKPKTASGTLRLKKSNPSGDPANEDVYEVKVRY